MSDQTKQPVTEILTITLKLGTRERFHHLYITESLPIQKKWKIDVMAHGPSLHDENIYYVFRSFENLKDMQEKEDTFYGSDDWQKGPRTAMLSLIEHISTAVISTEFVKELFSA